MRLRTVHWEHLPECRSQNTSSSQPSILILSLFGLGNHNAMPALDCEANGTVVSAWARMLCFPQFQNSHQSWTRRIWQLAHYSLLLARVKQTDGSGSQQLGSFQAFSPRAGKGCEEKSSLIPTEICLLSVLPSVSKGGGAKGFLLVISLPMWGQGHSQHLQAQGLGRDELRSPLWTRCAWASLCATKWICSQNGIGLSGKRVIRRGVQQLSLPLPPLDW